MAKPSVGHRVALSSASLYGILSAAFNLRRDPRCRACLSPLPMYRRPFDASNANWHTGALRACPYLCHLVLGEVQAELWNRYDLRVEAGEPDVPA